MKFVVVILFCFSPIWASPTDFSPRIIGGQLAARGQFPFAAALFFETVEGGYFCGGTLLNEQWILTAAHCLEGALRFEIYLGTTNLVSPDPEHLILNTTTYIIHPSYNSTILENDIGLINFPPIEFTDFIKPIGGLPSNRVTSDTVTLAVGWGRTSDASAVISNDLYYVPVTTISNTDCATTYGEFIKNTVVCVVGATIEGICTGDSGSALIQTTDSGKIVSVGIASFVSAAGCETEHPAGFTRTHDYADWIRNITGLPSSGSTAKFFVPVVIVVFIISSL